MRTISEKVKKALRCLNPLVASFSPQDVQNSRIAELEDLVSEKDMEIAMLRSKLAKSDKSEKYDASC